MQLVSYAIIIIYLAVLIYVSLVQPTQQSINLPAKITLNPGMLITTSAGIKGSIKAVFNHSVIITRTDGLIVEVLKITITSVHDA